MTESLLLQAPADARRLVLLVHGVGSRPEDLGPLGLRLAQAFPDAVVVSIAAPDRSDVGVGLQWFSVLGVTEANRPERVAATLPRFVTTVRAWQERFGLGSEQTTLIGFSQGAILSLASTQLPQPPAARVVSLSGRYPSVPTEAPARARIHFVHGAADPVIPAAHAQAAAQALQSLGATVTLDLLPGLGHGVNRAAEERLLALLRS